MQTVAGVGRGAGPGRFSGAPRRLGRRSRSLFPRDPEWARVARGPRRGHPGRARLPGLCPARGLLLRHRSDDSGSTANQAASLDEASLRCGGCFDRRQPARERVAQLFKPQRVFDRNASMPDFASAFAILVEGIGRQRNDGQGPAVARHDALRLRSSRVAS